MLSEDAKPWSVKLLWFWFPSVLGSFIWWYVVNQIFQGRLDFSSAGLANLILFVVFGLFSFALWVGSLVTSGYVTGRKFIRLVGALLVATPVLGFFPITSLTLGVFCVQGIVLWWASERFVQSAQSRIEVKPHLTAGWALPVIVTLLMVSVSTLYYQQLLGSTRSPEELGQRLSGQVVEIVERFLPTVYSEYRPEMTVDELLGSQIPGAETLLNDINFDELTDAAQKQQAVNDRLVGIEGFEPGDITINPDQSRQELEASLEQELAIARIELSANLRDGLSEQFGVPIAGDAQVHTVLIDLVSRQYDLYVSRYISIVPWILALGLFFVLKLFAGVFLFTTTWMGWLVIWLFKHLHILHITHETVPAERMAWGK